MTTSATSDQPTFPPTLIYDQLCEQWPEIWEQAAINHRIDPADPLVTDPPVGSVPDALEGDE